MGTNGTKESSIDTKESRAPGVLEVSLVVKAFKVRGQHTIAGSSVTSAIWEDISKFRLRF